MASDRKVGHLLFKSWLDKLPEKEKQNFKIEGKSIFCRPCAQAYQWNRVSQLNQHVGLPKHEKNCKFQQDVGKQTLLSESTKSEFNSDLCKALLAADIPFKKLSNPNFRGFLEKYCRKQVPHESTLRRAYVPNVYNDVLDKIRQDVDGRKVFIQVDETTDKAGRFVANVLVGALNKDSPPKAHLIMTKQLETTNNNTVTQLIIDSLQHLWPNVSQTEITSKFLVLLTDAAPYMIKAGKNLKGVYPGLVHVTCVAHGLHRVAETVRSSYKSVDEFVGLTKAIFKKAPARVRVYKEMHPDLPLPPEAVLVRWGTWLEAVEFLAKHYDEVKTVILSFDENDAECIRKAQDIIQNSNLQAQLADLLVNYTFLAETIKKFEERSLSLTESIRMLEMTSEKLSNCASELKDRILAKFRYVLGNNPGLETMSLVAATLSGNPTDFDLGMGPDALASLAYCPLTSVEVERSFSMAKAILDSRRMNFTMENFEKYLICHYEINACKD